MKLYISPGTCSLAPHIALREAELKVTYVKVQLGKDAKTEDGRDYRAINPTGAVPALELDSGELLTENAILLQYIASLAPEKQLMPTGGGALALSGDAELRHHRAAQGLQRAVCEAAGRVSRQANREADGPDRHHREEARR